jgi:serine/threonine-protein kinase
MTSKEITAKIRLKKVMPPVMTGAVIVLAAMAYWLFIPKKQAPPMPARKSSIAVLSFADLSHSKNNEYLCDGISETLINALTNIEGLWVPATTSAFFFKGKAQDIREIGQKLGVDNVLEGSVQVAGDNLRVTARISNIQTGRQVWSDIFNRKMADIFAIQDDIAKAIVTALKIKLLGEKGAPLIKKHTQNYEAYRLYLHGLNSWNKRGEANLINSVEYFEKAIALDPNYALAYAGVADAFSILGNNALWPAEKACPKAKAAALKALEIDNKLAEAHNSLAAIMQDYDWDFVGAEKEFKVAIEIAPGYATAHHWYALFLLASGHHEEAIREIYIARDLDPLSPRISANVGLVHYLARQYGQAIEELNKSLEEGLISGALYVYIGWAHEAVGNYGEAVQSYLQNVKLSGDSEAKDNGIACCYALMGRREEASKILNNIIECSKVNYESSVNIAEVFACLGETSQVFDWLETAVMKRDPNLIFYPKYHHRFDPIRSDPRYEALLHKVGLKK